MKLKFIGKSDYNFTNGKIYQLFHLDFTAYNIGIFISNDKKIWNC